MTVWAWIGLGAIGLIGLSFGAAFVIARILGAMGEELTQLLEEGAWASAPLTRGIERPVEDQPLVLRAADKI